MCLVFGGRMFRFWCSRCIVVFRGWLVVVYTGVSIHGAAAAVLCSKMNLISELCPYWYSQSYQGGWGSQRRTSTPCGWLMVMIMLLAHNTTNLWIHLNLSNIDPTPEQVRLCGYSSSRGSPLQSLQTKYVFLKSVVLRIIEWRDAIICLRPFVYIYIDSIQI